MTVITAEQKTLVQESFLLLADRADEFAEAFYNRLFLVDPSLRALFKVDIREQGKKLMQILTVAVHSLDNLEGIIPAVQALGARHLTYGVRSEDYYTVGQALLWTLRQFLGNHYSADLSIAWATVYSVLSEVAIQGAEAATEAALE